MPPEQLLLAEVVLERAGQSSYTYLVPDDLATVVCVGDLVTVPLRNRREQGFVTEIARRDAPAYKVRALSLPKRRVCLPEPLMKLADWGSRYYRCGTASFLNAMVPSPVRKGVEMQKTRLVTKKEQQLDDVEKPLTKRQLEVWHKLPLGITALTDAARLSACSSSTIERLIDAHALEHHVESEIKEQHISVLLENHTLTEEQQYAFERIKVSVDEQKFQPFLLYGITGSGKTLVYMELAQHVLDRGQTVLVMLPEIALTPQLAARFRHRFNNVSIWHSGFTAGERASAWHAAENGEVNLVIGTRSAIFAPLKNIGLIIVDEEHDQSYKQDSTPRYQGRDMAMVYAQQLQVPIVLGSATPSCETINNVREGRYEVIPLKKRPPGSRLPTAMVVNMREECKAQNKQAVLSQKLVDALRECHQAQQQSIILLNRRGWTPIVSCPRCGHVCKCDHCDISMTWHRGQNKLRCHMCAHEAKLPEDCPVCEYPELAHKGIGTERLVALIQEQIPELRIIRMDADTISKRQGHADIIQSFAAGEADCLVGTQMVAKGLDFPRVTLVGVVAADHGLAAPDFRAAERTYQLIAQVAGRSGRSEEAGQVIVQAYDPSEMAIDCALHNKPKTFYDEELSVRKRYAYPPYTALMRLLWKGENHSTVEQTAIKQSKGLQEHCQGEVILGPSPAGIAFVKGQYRWHTLVKASSRGAIQQLIKRINKSRILDTPKDVLLVIDIDPYDCY